MRKLDTWKPEHLKAWRPGSLKSWRHEKMNRTILRAVGAWKPNWRINTKTRNAENPPSPKKNLQAWRQRPRNSEIPWIHHSLTPMASPKLNWNLHVPKTCRWTFAARPCPPPLPKTSIREAPKTWKMRLEIWKPDSPENAWKHKQPKKLNPQTPKLERRKQKSRKRGTPTCLKTHLNAKANWSSRNDAMKNLIVQP